jgi:hypothetical protein
MQITSQYLSFHFLVTYETLGFYLRTSACFGATENFTSNVQGKSQIRACIAVVKVIAASLILVDYFLC